MILANGNSISARKDGRLNHLRKGSVSGLGRSRNLGLGLFVNVELVFKPPVWPPIAPKKEIGLERITREGAESNNKEAN